MKQELKNHLIPLLVIFVLISLFWVFQKVPSFEIIILFFGLALGSFFLDLDHFIYWLYLKPNLDESKLAQVYIKERNFKLLFKHLGTHHKNHSNLIFHHYFFQSILVFFSLFIFTSTTNTGVMAFLVALNVHLLVDEINDYYQDKVVLQNWLFAREAKQLPIRFLSRYIMIFILFLLIFIIILATSKI